jgi:hypothetical protein
MRGRVRTPILAAPRLVCKTVGAGVMVTRRCGYPATECAMLCYAGLLCCIYLNAWRSLQRRDLFRPCT